MLLSALSSTHTHTPPTWAQKSHHITRAPNRPIKTPKSPPPSHSPENCCVRKQDTSIPMDLSSPSTYWVFPVCAAYSRTMWPASQHARLKVVVDLPHDHSYCTFSAFFPNQIVTANERMKIQVLFLHKLKKKGIKLKQIQWRKKKHSKGPVTIGHEG